MRVLGAAGLFSAFMLVGCSSSFVSQPGTGALGAGSAEIRGTVYGGQQPVAGSLVSVYEVGSTGYGTGAILKATTTTSTDGQGAFAFAANAYTCTAANSPMYITATGGNAGSGTNSSLALIAGLGPCTAARNSFVSINEVTTVGTVFALSGFMGTTLGAGGTVNNIGGTCTGCAPGTYNQGLVNAMNITLPQLVNTSNGAPLISGTAGGVTITREPAKLITMANVLAACVNSSGSTGITEILTTCGQLFNFTKRLSGGPRPSDTLQAALQMVAQPYQSVSPVFALGVPQAPFPGGLATAPNDWTVGISYASASFGLGINVNTSSNLEIDAQGRPWFPTNAATGIGLGYFDPASTTFNGPYGGQPSGHDQYVTIDATSTPTVWTSDLLSAGVRGVRVASPTSVSIVTSTGLPNFSTAGPVSVDATNQVGLIGFSSGGSAQMYFFQPGAVTASSATVLGTLVNGVTSFGNAPFGTLATGGNAYVSYQSVIQCGLGSLTGNTFTSPANTSFCVPGGIADPADNQSLFSTTSNNRVCDLFGGACTVYTSGLSTPEGIAVDGLGGVWVANSGNASVSTMQYSVVNAVLAATSPVAYIHGTGNGATMTTPYGIATDPSGNVWVSNAGCVSTTATACTPGAFVLSELVGAAAPTLTPIVAVKKIGLGPQRPAK